MEKYFTEAREIDGAANTRLGALLAAGNKLHDLAWIDPLRGFRLVGSADTLPPIDRLARRHLRRFPHELALLTLAPSGQRHVTRRYARRWRWWPFVVRVVPYSEISR